MSGENGPDDGGSKKKTIEGIYQKKSQLEHILLRPDTYIGSVEPVTEQMWVYDKEKEVMIQKEIKYVPGLYKIFDEILVNAADNKQRDPKMDCIKIDIDQENNTISVWNNGKGIPVVIHKEEKMYVPTMIFGHLLTSSNYDDDEEKVTGGRNGYGAKLCNIFSHRFTVETACKEYKRSFKQVWGDNMGKASESKIKDFHGEDFTKVTFSPDLQKFKMEKLDNDIVMLMSRRAFDVAASTRGVKVILNGTRVPVKSFKDYVDLFVKNKEDDTGNPLKVAYENCNERWEVAVTISDKGFQQMSFVNSIATTKGGRHVDHVTDIIVKQLIETLKKKNRAGIQIKPFQIKNHLWVFVNCLINNPTFDSQTKEHMTLQQKSFGSKCTLTEKFTAAVMKIGIVESVLSWAKFKADSQLQKLGPKSKQRKLAGIPKLEDANDAGTGRSLECTLILTEGDSAKSMAITGLSSIGRDKYGVFPLKGKLLNVREATHKQILENAEINNLIKILGLQYKKKYESRDDMKTLRYGKIMIMTDQDQDGSHIKGLIINFIHHNWPSLLSQNFIEEFITPIVKAKKKGQKDKCFYSIPEFEIWKKETEDFHTYQIKYYKGLGTSTGPEAKEYFQDMARHRIKFRYEGELDDQNIIMAFSKKCVEQRKDWLTNHMEETKRRKEIGLGEKYLYQKDTKTVSFSDFINLELVLFSMYDNVRSIPNVIDGFKPGQRKVIYTCLKRNDKREIKVAQLAASVAEQTAYHHGEASVMSTIINLAQDFVGSNNVNLLQPIGQFGTRLQGGKDAASPRYIHTKLSPLARFIFHKHDDAILTHEYEDNQKVEPKYFVPIVPMVLINGADGIGTGWMTKIPNYDIRDIAQNLLRMMDGGDPTPMKPFYKGFIGEIDACGEYRFIFSGEIAIIGEDKLEIKELPIGVWTQHYKESVLEPMLHGTDKSPAIITDYKEYNTDTTVHFVITATRDKLRDLEREGLHKVFKLQSTTSTTSMCAFDHNLCLKKYDTVLEIMREFFTLRLDYYQKRKNYLEGILQAEAAKLSNQSRFILEKCDGSLVIENKKKKDMIAELVRKKYDSDPILAWKLAQNREEALEEVAENDDETSEAAISSKENYDYLLGMAMWNLTKEKKDALLRQRDEKVAEYQRLQCRTPLSLWKEDIENLLSELQKLEDKEKQENTKTKATSKKPPARLYRDEDPRRIIPTIDDELKKKIERAEIISKDKKDGVKKERKGKKEKDVKEDKDEFDALIENNAKSLDARLGSSPEKLEGAKEKKGKGGKRAMKQSTLPFKAVKKKKKGSGSEDDEEIDFDSLSPPPVQRSKRAAAGKAKYKIASSGEESDSSEASLHSIGSGNEDKPTTRLVEILDSDSDNDVKSKPPTNKPSSEELFDSLINDSSEQEAPKGKPINISSEKSDQDNKTKKKKPAPKKKNENGGGGTSKVTKRGPKKKLLNKSDSDSDIFSAKKGPAKKRKKKSESDDEQVDDDSIVEDSPPPKKTTARITNRKKISYKITSDGSDSDY